MRRIVLLLLVAALQGCQLGYYLHLAAGHARLMSQREPIDEVLARPDVEPEVARKLRLTPELRALAADTLKLPVGDAYTSWVDLGRDWATWNVFAAPPLSLEPYLWCYPLTGCVSYRGYFDRDRAAREVGALRARGLETWQAGSSAYSTLGWFDDPVLSTMLQGDDLWFAEVLLHELVHRRLYIPDDTRFNESLATAVARAGLLRWLEARGGDGAALRRDLRMRDRARQQVLALVEDARERLARVYASSRPAADRRSLRDALRWQLRARYLGLLRDHPAVAGYRRWFEGPLNNAQLNTMADYEALVPAFERLLAVCDERMDCFWGRVERLSELPAEQRGRALEDLLPEENKDDA